MSKVTDLSGWEEDIAKASLSASPAHAVPSGTPVRGTSWLRKQRLLNTILSLEEPDRIDVSAGKFSPGGDK